MVTGIDRFREYFAAHEDEYAIIGGAACDLLFGTAGLDFRATRDIDVVLCVEVVDVAFARACESAGKVTPGRRVKTTPLPRFVATRTIGRG